VDRQFWCIACRSGNRGGDEHDRNPLAIALVRLNSSKPSRGQLDADERDRRFASVASRALGASAVRLET